MKPPYNNLDNKYVLCTSPLIEYPHRGNVQLLCITFLRVIQGLMGYQFAVSITLYRGVHVEVSSFLSFLKVSYNHVIVIDACIILRTCIVLVTCIWTIHPCILFIKILAFTLLKFVQFESIYYMKWNSNFNNVLRIIICIIFYWNIWLICPEFELIESFLREFFKLVYLCLCLSYMFGLVFFTRYVYYLLYRMSHGI